MDTSEGPSVNVAASKNEMTKNYIVTSHKPSVISAAVVGFFRNKDELGVVVARVDRLLYYSVSEEGMKTVFEIPIFGRIATLNLYRVPGDDLDSIIVLTVKYQLAILSFDNVGVIRNRAYGVMADRVGRPAETGIITCVHKQSGLIALRLYDGFLKLIPWKEERNSKEEIEPLVSFNVRFEDHNVTDIDFIDEDVPTVVYLHEDTHGKHMKICQIDLERKEMTSIVMQQDGIETAATLLISVPKPCGGAIVVGQESISYLDGRSRPVCQAPPPLHEAHFNCYARIDPGGDRFLLGDVSGRLLMLIMVYEYDGDVKKVVDLRVEELGHVSIPECLVYIDNSVIFVGSRFGDSQLVKVTTEPINSSESRFLQVLDTLPNIGPIRDFIIMEKDGNRQLVSCSGCYKNGSLRVVRSGIGIDELATADIPNIKNLFTLKLNSDVDRYLVAALYDYTYLIKLEGDTLDSVPLDGFDRDQTTLFAGNISSNRLVQVTPDGVRLISGDGLFCTKWKAPERLALCSANMASGQLVVVSAAEIYYLIIAADEIRMKSQYSCVNEVACIDISPLEPGKHSKFFVAAFWMKHNIILFSVDPDVRPLKEVDIGTDMLPRSILIVQMEEILYIMVALGDATIHYFKMDKDTGDFLDRKKVSLGTMPATLKKFEWKGSTNVFFCSDRPAVIFSTNQKLSFSNVNLKSVVKVEMLNSDYYKDCLVMTDGQGIMIGNIDHIQKLHVRTVSLGESVSRIAYQPETNTLAILTTRYEHLLKNGQRWHKEETVSLRAASKTTHASNVPCAEAQGALADLTKADSDSSRDMNTNDVYGTVEVHSVCVLDANSFECLYVCELSTNEYGLSLCSAMLSTDTVPYYVVGTAITSLDDKEPKLGRLIVLQVEIGNGNGDASKLRIVHEREVKGAVYSISTLSQKIVCAVNSSVRLFEWTAEHELRLECSHFNNITALYVKTKGDLVLVGDLMRSICLISYKTNDSTFEELARDYTVEWTSACEIIDSDTFLGAENHYNLFCCQKNNQSTSEEERNTLKQVGCFYLGQMVNAFRCGTIITKEPETSMQHIAESNPIMYGTSDGGLGVIVQIADHIYDYLLDLQKRIANHLKNCMKISHNDYRNFSVERRAQSWTGFIDGDLIETICQMPIEDVQAIIEGIEKPPVDIWKPSTEEKELATVDDVLKFVEDLSRIH